MPHSVTPKPRQTNTRPSALNPRPFPGPSPLGPASGFDHDRELVVADVDEPQLDAALGVEGDRGGGVDAGQDPAFGPGPPIGGGAGGAVSGQLPVLVATTYGVGVGLPGRDGTRRSLWAR